MVEEGAKIAPGRGWRSSDRHFQPLQNLSAFGSHLHLAPTAILGGLSGQTAELADEATELVSIHHKAPHFLGDVGEPLACGLCEELVDDAVKLLALAEIAVHQGELGGLDGHFKLGDVGAGSVADVIVLADFTGQGVSQGLLCVLTEICVSPFDGGHFDNLHSGHFLSCSVLCTLIIAHISRFVNTFFQLFQKTFFDFAIDKFDFLCYNVYSGREGAYMRGPYANICSHYTAPGRSPS